MGRRKEKAREEDTERRSVRCMLLLLLLFSRLFHPISKGHFRGFVFCVPMIIIACKLQLQGINVCEMQFVAAISQW